MERTVAVRWLYVQGSKLQLGLNIQKFLFMNYHDIITIEPGKRSGKPCIRGMRITIYDILEYLAGGMTEA